ncbi:MAG: hypothetical protein WCP18_02380 [bacterium]
MAFMLQLKTSSVSSAVLLSIVAVVSVIAYVGILLITSSVGPVANLAAITPGLPLANNPGICAIVDPCTTFTGDRQKACYQAYYKFSCSQPIAIKKTDYAQVNPLIFDASRLTSPCACFCQNYFNKPGIALPNTAWCQGAAYNFTAVATNTNIITNNPVMTDVFDGNQNFTNPL